VLLLYSLQDSEACLGVVKGDAKHLIHSRSRLAPWVEVSPPEQVASDVDTWRNYNTEETSTSISYQHKPHIHHWILARRSVRMPFSRNSRNMQIA